GLPELVAKVPELARAPEPAPVKPAPAPEPAPVKPTPAPEPAPARPVAPPEPRPGARPADMARTGEVRIDSGALAAPSPPTPSAPTPSAPAPSAPAPRPAVAYSTDQLDPARKARLAATAGHV